MSIDLISRDDNLTIPGGAVWGEILGYKYVINTQGHYGIVVLNGMALDIMTLCQESVLNVGQLRDVLPWDGDCMKNLEHVLDRLAQLEVLSVNPKLTEKYESNRRSDYVKTYSVWLQLTDDCNLNCPHCFVPKRPKYMDYETACSMIRKLSEDAINSGFQRIMIKLAGGEPTLNWDVASRVIDRFSHDEDLGIEVRFSVITNGVSIPQDLISRVSDSSLGMALSLDGVGHWHNSQRPFPDGSASEFLSRGGRQL